MNSEHVKSQSTRYDVPTEIFFGPVSKTIRLKEVANDPFLKQAIKPPIYSHSLSQEQEDALRKRCSINDIQEEVKERMDDKKLSVQLRSRLLTWIEEGAPGNAETYRLKRKRKRAEAAERITSSREGTEGSVSLSPEIFESGSNSPLQDCSALEDLQNNVPKCFKIMADAKLASAYHHQGGRLDESAIKNPVPSRLLKASYGESNMNMIAEKEQHTTQNHFMLSINVYARPPRGMWVKERFDRMVRSVTENGKYGDEINADNDGNDDIWQEGERFEIPERSKPGPKAMLGRTGPYEALQLAQQIEIRSDSTLKDLRDGIVCRMDDLPGAVDREKNFKAWSKLVRDDDLSSFTPQMQQFTGRKRETDSCFLIENMLYGEDELMEDGKSYANLLSTHFSKSNDDGLAVVPTASPQRMDEVKLESIDLHTGKLHWFLHQGSCEHVWTITSIRQARLSEQKASPEAITHFLKYNFMVRPLVRWARPTKRTESYSLDFCNLCEERQAIMIIIGGERFRSPNKEIRLEGLKEENVSVCETCWYALNGEKAPSLEQIVKRAGSELISNRSDTSFARASGKGWTVIPLLE